MKRFLRQLTVSSVGVAVLAQGQPTSPLPSDEMIRPVELVPIAPKARNRVSVSYRMGLNITADFKKLGGLAALSNPGPAQGGAVNRTYDNGYNLIDIANNDHGPGFQNTTWNWGYQNAGALQGNEMVFTSSSSPANGVSRDNSNDPQHGFEIGYSRELWQKGKWRGGFEGALGYMRLSISDSRTIVASVTRITDSFAIPTGVTVPPAPYNGSFNGPGAVIGSEPVSRTQDVLAGAATIVGSRSVEADIYSLRLGPYAEWPLNDKFSVLLNVGCYLAMGDTHFRFQETVTVPGTGSEFHSGAGSQSDLLVGFYGGANLQYALTKDVALFVGAQFQTAGRPANRQKGKVAILNLDQSVIVSIGASYSF